MRRRLRNRKGQSILEYLVIATIVVLAVLAIRGAVQAQTDAVMNAAATKVGEGAAHIGTYVVGPH